ncbi:AAA family ATPase [Streptomyces sp. NBC_01210]|uniref:helix-turn-helix transcriptional regulator n=1 Tax=Streptomyces sp. NBC_01210 TaxID=2903774 RepID=UPI002E1562A8|nr:AAA family ATPase [Streptomyces sp. NBC_01210]
MWDTAESATTPAQTETLAGRRDVLSALSGALRQVGARQPVARLVKITGDPGIGKTAVLGKFAGIARSGNSHVFTGRVNRHDDDAPFGLISDAFDDQHDLVRAAVEGLPPWQREDLNTVLRLTMDFDRERAADAVKSMAQTGFRAVREFLEQLSVPRLVLVLDDYHVADPASVELLASLLRRPPRAPVLFALAYRNRQATPSLQAALRGRSEQVIVEHIHLEPLLEEEVGEMLAGEATAFNRRHLYRESGGNPGYLKALISEQPVFTARDDLSRLNQTPRFGNYARYTEELAPLRPEMREVADAAAVVGHEFEAGLLTQMLGRNETAVLGTIGELIRRDLVHPVVPGQYFAFRHPVVHRAVYNHSELSWRVDMHLRADEALCTRGAPAVERAPHVEQWIKHGDLPAVEVLDEAARTVASTDPGRASAWLTTALRALPQQPRFEGRRARMMTQPAEARGAMGQLQECRDLMHEALSILPREPAPQHAEAVAFAAMVQRLLGRREETDAMLRLELDALGSEDALVRASLKFEIAAGQLHSGDPLGCYQWAQEALTVVERHGHRPLQASCLGLMAMANTANGRTGLAHELLGQATTILDGMLDSELAQSLDAVMWIGWSEVLLERWDEALRHFDKGVSFATRSGYRLFMPHLLAGKAFVLRDRGKLTEAQIAVEHAVYLAERTDSPEELVNAYAVQGYVDIALGNLDGALQNSFAATLQPRHSASSWKEALALRILAEARLLNGDPEGCLALVTDAGGADLPTADAGSRVAWYELLVRAELAAGRPGRAADWAQRAMHAANLLEQPGRIALATLAEAQVLLRQNPDAALAPAQHAAAGLEEAGRAIDALRARVAVGLALWQEGRFDDAAQELKATQLACEQLGATALARAARVERRRLAARAPHARSTDSESSVIALTGREQQIAALVSDGLTNRLIAKKLHIAEKTVEMHLSNVFAKLGVSNRAAVAATVTREGPDSLPDSVSGH